MNNKSINEAGSLFDLLNLAKKLPSLERDLFFFILKKGRASISQLASFFKIDQKLITKALEHLVQLSLLMVYQLHNIRFYELSLEKRSRFVYERFPSGPIIPLIYHFNLLSDNKRLSGFQHAIESTIRRGDIVFDVGCGSGILSILSAKLGAYVFAIEVDYLVADAAEYFIKNSGYQNKIKLIKGDVREFHSNTKADVIICEMIDTALISELQVPVMNYAVENLVKEGTRFIPISSTTSAQLINVDYSFLGFDFPLIHFEEYGSRSMNFALSEPTAYHWLSFSQVNPLDVDEVVKIYATRKGVVNGLRITTEISLKEDVVLQNSSWFNPPLVLPIDNILVKESDVVEARIQYELGGGFANINYKGRKEKLA